MEGRPERRGPGRPSLNGQNCAALMAMAEAMREQAVATTNLINYIAQRGFGVPGGGPAHVTIPKEDPNHKWYKFRKNQPPSFIGGTNPAEAQYWLREMEKIFCVVQCSQEQKVTFATHFLKAEAENWWRGARERMVSLGTPLTWEKFQTAFLGKYFPQSVREQKELEFTRLVQGEMTIAEYTAKFEELAKYLPHLHYATYEEWKITQYELGLRPEIRCNVSQLGISEYAILVEKCQVAEANLAFMQEEYKEKMQKRKVEEEHSQQLEGDSVEKETQTQVFGSFKRGECRKCGKNHRGECLAGSNICFICKQPRHSSHSCLTQKNKGVIIPGNSSWEQLWRRPIGS